MNACYTALPLAVALLFSSCRGTALQPDLSTLLYTDSWFTLSSYQERGLYKLLTHLKKNWKKTNKHRHDEIVSSALEHGCALLKNIAQTATSLVENRKITDYELSHLLTLI